MDQFERYLEFQKEVAQPKRNIIEQFQNGGQPKSKERTAKIVIVHNVLNDAGMQSTIDNRTKYGY